MKKEFIVNRSGKDFVLYAGLLDQAHREGLKRITTKVVQTPSDENGRLAIVFAEVETEKGIFSGIGDASPENVGRMIAMHTVRMAETRAKARALRDAINVGVTAFEELGDVDDDSHAPTSADGGPSRRPASPQPTPQPQPAPTQRQQNAPSGNGPTDRQRTRILGLQKACGLPQQVPAGMTAEGAITAIRELTGMFNAQARGATPAATPTPDEPREPTDLHWALALDLCSQWHIVSGEALPDLDEWDSADRFEGLIDERLAQLANLNAIAGDPPPTDKQCADLATARDLYRSYGDVRMDTVGHSATSAAWLLATLREVLDRVRGQRKAAKAVPAAK